MGNQDVSQKWIEHDKKIRPYLWSHRILNWTYKLLSFLLFISFIVTHRFGRLESVLNSSNFTELVSWICYFGALGVVWEVVAIPFAVSHHWIERAHHLSTQSYLGWWKDRFKGYLVGAIIGTVAISVVFYAIQWGGTHWWWILASSFIVLMVILAQIAPVVLIPFFFKLKSMDEGELKTRLLEMSQRFGVKVEDVYHLGMGEKTEKGNAAFVGIGKTKRILIGDTLYKKFPAEEVEAVFAHELGHQVNGDLIKGILLSSVLMFVVFWGAQLLCEEILFLTFKTNEHHPFGVVLFFVTCSIVSLPIGFLQNVFSRKRERMADKFAKEKLKSGKHLASALERLTFQNHGLFKPNTLVEHFSYSHPAPWRRIAYLTRD